MIARHNSTAGYWRRDPGTATDVECDTSSGLVYVVVLPIDAPRNSKYARRVWVRAAHSNRRPEWWRPLQPRREKRPLSVRLWQAEQTRRKKAARTSERRERKSRA